MFVFSVSVLPIFKEHISRNTFQWLLPNIAQIYAILKIILENVIYVQHLNILNIAPMGKARFMAPMEKA